MKKLKMIWNCNQVSGMNGKITVNGFSPVLGDKINKTIAKMHHVGEMKIQAEEGTEGYDFFKDGKNYIVEISEAPAKKGNLKKA